MMHTLAEMAKVLKVHPRTILRRLYPDDPNPYWAPGFEDRVNCSQIEIVTAFGIPQKTLTRLIQGADILFNQGDAAEYLNVPIRTFRYRKYPAAIDQPGVVRYSRKQIANYNIYHHR